MAEATSASRQLWDNADDLRLLRIAQAIHGTRRKLDAVFGPRRGALHGHNYDIMVYLYIGHLRHEAISVSTACYAVGAPPTTGLRGIAKLEENDLVKRCGDPFDKRRQLLTLTPLATDLMRRYLDVASGHAQ